MSASEKRILEMNAFDVSGEGLENCDPLVKRRLENYGAASVLFYEEPIVVASAHDSWLVAGDGTEYLDFYNNVPSVGHCHPRVVEAVSSQIGKLNIHTRYVSPVVDDYVEALKALFPDYLNNVLMSCTGSEANDLAMRLSMVKSGNKGFIVTENAYHGNTSIVNEISPSAYKGEALVDHVLTVPAPSKENYGEDIEGGFLVAVQKATAELDSRGFGLAALVCDSIFSSDGVYPGAEGFLLKSVDFVQSRGSCYIADEVQPGFGRTGSHFWGFERHSIKPDFVTMGKPMGNGFPMAAVVANSKDIEAFCESVGYFNTFGGNPVAAAAGKAVLDVIKDEALMQHTQELGSYLMKGLKELQAKSSCIGDVRGVGFFIGVDICKDSDPSQPDPSKTIEIINQLKAKRVLIGSAGKYGHTLKVRPPLCLGKKEVDIFLSALAGLL